MTRDDQANNGDDHFERGDEDRDRGELKVLYYDRYFD